MADIAARPTHLPDFRNPPIAEVVLGVQFAELPGYSPVRAGDVWSLFKDQYPVVRENPPLPPVFEAFGLPSQILQIPFRIMSAVPHPRFWFMRQDGSEFIQFQKDRLIHNWQREGKPDREYPRYEAIRERFLAEIHRLEEFSRGLSGTPLQISQCEINYVNNAVSEDSAPVNPSDWIRCVKMETEAEDFSFNFREQVRNSAGALAGRFYCEIGNGYRQDGVRILIMNLTVRGAPLEPSIASAMEFFDQGREKIVTRFAELTTTKAHDLWGRIK
jgi:uncharacterized protein (TIGR04255 family)